MNQIERLRDDLVRRFPELSADIDAPTDERGSWFLDVRRAGEGLSPVVVEWRPDRGFGVSTPRDDDYGAGPDEVYTNVKAALDRVVSLVLSCLRSEPPKAVRLAELRRLRGISQPELARRAGVGQANVSRIESRSDLKISTLAGVVNAMGGELRLVVRFSDGTEREIDISRSIASVEPNSEGLVEDRRRGVRSKRRPTPSVVQRAHVVKKPSGEVR